MIAACIICTSYFFLSITCVNNSFLIYLIVYFFLVYTKSGYTTRIGQYVRPAVYTITFDKRVVSWWNFLHSLVLSISRSSSKMRMIGQEMPELSKKLSWLIEPSLRGSTGIFSKTNVFLELFARYINLLSF